MRNELTRPSRWIARAARAAVGVACLVAIGACDPGSTANDGATNPPSTGHPGPDSEPAAAANTVVSTPVFAAFGTPEALVASYLTALATADIDMLRDCLLPSDRKRFGSREALASVFTSAVRAAASDGAGERAYPTVDDLRASATEPADRRDAGAFSRARTAVRDANSMSSQLVAVGRVAVFRLALESKGGAAAAADAGSNSIEPLLVLRRIGDRWYVRLYPELDDAIPDEVRARFGLPELRADVLRRADARPLLEPGTVIPHPFWRPGEGDDEANMLGPLQPPDARDHDE